MHSEKLMLSGSIRFTHGRLWGPLKAFLGGAIDTATRITHEYQARLDVCGIKLEVVTYHRMIGGTFDVASVHQAPAMDNKMALLRYPPEPLIFHHDVYCGVDAAKSDRIANLF